MECGAAVAHQLQYSCAAAAQQLSTTNYYNKMHSKLLLRVAKRRPARRRPQWPYLPRVARARSRKLRVKHDTHTHTCTHTHTHSATTHMSHESFSAHAVRTFPPFSV